jgi:SagB-type dehydrogenase family enzyme
MEHGVEPAGAVHVVGAHHPHHGDHHDHHQHSADQAQETTTAALVRTPHLAASWSGDQLVLVDGTTGRAYAASLSVLRVLSLATNVCDAGELAERAEVDSSFIDDLVAGGLLITPEELLSVDHWTAFELVLQRMAGGGGLRASLDWDGMPEMRKGSWSGDVVELAGDGGLPRVDLADVLQRRRSRWDFSAEPLDIATLSCFLVGAARVDRAFPATGASSRPHLSAGGRHPLEVNVAALRVRGLARGVHWFDAFDRTLHEIPAEPALLDDLPAELGRSLGLDGPCQPAAVVLVTAAFARTMWMFEGAGLSLVYQDTGSLLQTCHLVATSLGLASCAVHLRGELTITRWLGLDPREESLVGCFALGLPA